MPEKIYKLQPNRTIQLRGFDSLGAAAALHSASDTAFKVSGIFRDPADFAVLILWDADNFYEHPALKYLPDWDFSGLTLQFDVRYRGLMPLDSPKYPTIDWPYLDVIRMDGSSKRIRLFDYAQLVGGRYTPASATFTIVDNGLKMYDRITLWYLNIAFDYLVSDPVECAYLFVGSSPGTVHSVTINGVTYSHVQSAADTNTSIAQAMAALVSQSPEAVGMAGDGSPELGPANQLTIRARPGDGSSFTVSSSAAPTVFTLRRIGAASIAANLADQINGVNWAALGVLHPLHAEANGPDLRISSTRQGADGNMLRMYAVAKNDRLTTSSPMAEFTGGSSDAVWRITLDFSALDIAQPRLMWLTFAPDLNYGAPYQPTEWEAEFTNWRAFPEAKRLLKVAGPGSVRIEEDDPRCTFSGSWGLERGFYSGNFALRSSEIGAQVTVRYSCAYSHELWLGTSLYIDRGVFGVTLDGVPLPDLNCYLPNEPAVVTRRRLAQNVPPGEHTLLLTVKSGPYVYFDFLEAVVPSDVPDPVAVRNDLSPALDYSTDHTYKLPPARIHWILDKLGFAGPMNEYIGVFWWNQRRREGAVIPRARVRFSGQFAPGDQIFIDIGGQICGKTVFANELVDPSRTPPILARHFACFINATFVGLWAAVDGDDLIIETRSPAPAYNFPLRAWIEPAPGSSGALSVIGSLTGGSPGVWVVDPDQSPALNAGARAWHADMFAQCAARGRNITVAASMELVNPPRGFAAMFPDGQPVRTDVGFGSLHSTHCTFNSAMLAYQKQVYACLANLMAQAGLTPNLQFGEFLWWFFTNWSPSNPNGGMAFYDPETQALAQTQLGRPLHIFRRPDDDPALYPDDVAFLQQRLHAHVTQLMAHIRQQHPDARFELLFPYDVNHPFPSGVHNLGGPLNRQVNFPPQWASKSTAGFDRIKMEALDFGAWSRNLDLAFSAIRFPLDLGWPRDSVRYLVPVFRGKYPWIKEVDYALGLGIPAVNLWAFDHVCLFGLEVGERRLSGRAMKIS
jgi:hypothetical protein